MLLLLQDEAMRVTRPLHHAALLLLPPQQQRGDYRRRRLGIAALVELTLHWWHVPSDAARPQPMRFLEQRLLPMFLPAPDGAVVSALVELAQDAAPVVRAGRSASPVYAANAGEPAKRER